MKKEQIQFTARLNRDTLRALGHAAVDRDISSNAMLQVAVDEWLTRINSPESPAEWSALSAHPTLGPMLRSLLKLLRSS